MTPQGRRNAQHSLLPQRNKPHRSIGAYPGEVTDPPFEEAADQPEAEETAEEKVEEASLMGDHRRIRTRQEEYWEKHWPYPTPPINSLVYPPKYSQVIERKPKISCYSGAHTVEPTGTIPYSQSPSLRL